MGRRRSLADLRHLSYYAGLVVLSLTGLMLLPLVTALIRQEWAIAVDFAAGIGVGATVGFGLMLLRPAGTRDLNWTEGMAAVALSWVVSTLVAAVPYWLSGQWGSFLDAAFDVMSGFTTTGLVLIQDLDHTSDGINMWRFVLTWVGGQGMVVLALTFLARGLPGAFKLYAGEAKDERLLPNVLHTARAIWYISIAYLTVGTLVLWGVALATGMTPGRAFLHGLWVFMSGWSTGGFAPMSQSILYYHSLPFELATVVFFVIGSLNFNLHWALWTGNRREVLRNLETVTFLITLTVLVTVASWELGRTGVYPTVIALMRRGFYSLISAHTTTGFMTTYAPQFVREWGPLALTGITIAMLLGASASSTAGGFKAVRVGLAARAVQQDVRRLLAPESAVVVQRFHMTRDAVLDDRMARSALSIMVLYVAMWFVLMIVLGLYAPRYGWDLATIVFEAASVTGNVGLSAGLTTPALPAAVKVVFIFAMWLGRMEFLSAFVLLGFLFGKVRSR